jgi:nicotinamidase-related amidase
MTRSALLVIDVQVDVAPSSPVRGEVIATINSLIGRARAEDVPVIFVRHSDEDLPLDSPGWQFDPALDHQGEPVVEKNYRDAFLATNLDDLLRSADVHRLVITGIQSDFCVQVTANSALPRGYDIALVADGHTTEDAQLADGASLSATRVSAWVNRQFSSLSHPGRTVEVVRAAEVTF